MIAVLSAGLLLPISIGTRAGQPEVSPVAARFPSVREQIRLTLPDANADTVLTRLGALEAASDTMSAAIALANNYYYPNGDAAVRRLIPSRLGIGPEVEPRWDHPGF